MYVIGFLCEFMIRPICGNILLIILCSFRTTIINRRSLAFEVVCRQPHDLKQKPPGYAQIINYEFGGPLPKFFLELTKHTIDFYHTLLTTVAN